MKKLKTIMVMNGAKALLWEALIDYHFSDDDESRILRCINDLEICVKEITENDMQAEIDRLREALQNIINATNLWLPKGGLKVDTPYMMNMRALNKIAEEALNGESEGK